MNNNANLIPSDDDGTDEEVEDKNFISPQKISSDDPTLRKRSVLIPTSHNGRSLHCAEEPSNPKQSIQALMQLYEFIVDKTTKPGQLPIKPNEHVQSLMNHTVVAWLETLYAFENANEKEMEKIYDEDEYISKVLGGDEEAFLQSLRENTNEVSQKMLLYLQGQKLKEYQETDALSSNKILEVRSSFIRNVVKVFEFGTLTFYINVKRNMKMAFDYAMWFFRNSSIVIDEHFVKIMLAILDAVVVQNFNNVLDVVQVVAPSLLNNDEEQEDPEEISQYLSLKINQSIACITRLELASKMYNYLIPKNYFDTMLERVKTEFSCISELKEIFDINPQLFPRSEQDIIKNLKFVIMENWQESWESKLDADIILSQQTALPSQLNTALTGGVSSGTPSTNFPPSNTIKFSEWLSIFPECEVFNTLRTETAKPTGGFDTDEGWLQETATDPVGVMNAMQRSLEGVHSHIVGSRKDAYSLVCQKEEIYKENIRQARLRRARLEQLQAKSAANKSTDSATNRSTESITPKRKYAPTNGSNEPFTKKQKQ